MAKSYRATITYTLTPDENGFLDSDYDMYDEDELKENRRTPDEMFEYVRDELYEIITNSVLRENNLYQMIDVEVIDE